MSKNTYWFNKKKDTTDRDEEKNTEVPEKIADYDPRVRAFVKSFKPALDQQDEKSENLRITELRKFFNAYVASQSGFDPLVKILNQLEKEGFFLEVAQLSNDFVLPCVRIRTRMNMLPTHDE